MSRKTGQHDAAWDLGAAGPVIRRGWLCSVRRGHGGRGVKASKLRTYYHGPKATCATDGEAQRLWTAQRQKGGVFLCGWLSH